eukprot:363916-Chlamydomonas_euryale.AAC.6
MLPQVWRERRAEWGACVGAADVKRQRSEGAVGTATVHQVLLQGVEGEFLKSGVGYQNSGFGSAAVHMLVYECNMHVSFRTAVETGRPSSHPPCAAATIVKRQLRPVDCSFHPPRAAVTTAGQLLRPVGCPSHPPRAAVTISTGEWSFKAARKSTP